ncbi:MAG: thermonuclease family protein [Candidatus Moraniibacteriota bacterium]
MPAFWTLPRRSPRSILSLSLVILFNLAYFTWPTFHDWTDKNLFQKNPQETVQSRVSLVKRVVDGDTFELESGEKVRLIGVDTPESVKPNTPVQCFGKEASNYLEDLLEGKEVRLEKDVSETDRYGRLLRYAYLDDELVNEKLVREGYASAASFPPDVSKQDLFRQAEGDARTHERGLWAKDTCSGKR